MSDVIALFVSDIHLSHTPPIARSAEPDWYAAMERDLRQLYEMSKKYGGCPIICAGDIFDRYNPPPELINFAIRFLPKMFAVPGQHDMPYHKYDDLDKSAYQVLVNAGVIEDLKYDKTVWHKKLVLYGVPYGFDIPMFEKFPGNRVNVLVCHKYIWDSEEHAYLGVGRDSKWTRWKKVLKGYDVAVFGDNHCAFVTGVPGLNVVNCGCLIRRKFDEKRYSPSVVELRDDGTVCRRLLDVSEDKWMEDATVESNFCREELDGAIEALGGLSSSSLDYRDAVNRVLESGVVSDRAKEILLEELDR